MHAVPHWNIGFAFEWREISTIFFYSHETTLETIWVHLIMYQNTNSGLIKLFNGTEEK